MRILKVIAYMFCMLFLCSACLLKSVGGAFKHEPGDLKRNISAKSRKFIDEALADVKGGKLFDYHVHVLGLGKNDSGIYVNERLLSWTEAIEHLKMLVYLSAAGTPNDEHVDINFIKRLLDLAQESPAKMRYLLLAFDYYYEPDGHKNLKKTQFFVPNEWVFALAAAHPKNFVAAMSVHPYRKDALSELQRWAKKGGRIVKWLPNAMGIDPSDLKIDAYYKKMRELDLILLSHTGEEQAVDAQNQELGNPLLLRRPLDLGVKVIAAHCASLGDNEDLDNPGHKEKSFKLFLRLMDDPKYNGLLFADISALTQANRMGEPLETMLKRSDLHHRLINGSDYPLPAINIVIRTRDLAKKGYITKEERKILNEIYDYNPLLFDYLVKRTIRHPRTGDKFSPRIFEEHPLLVPIRTDSLKPNL